MITEHSLVTVKIISFLGSTFQPILQVMIKLKKLLPESWWRKRRPAGWSTGWRSESEWRWTHRRQRDPGSWTTHSWWPMDKNISRSVSKAPGTLHAKILSNSKQMLGLILQIAKDARKKLWKKYLSCLWIF